MSYDIYIEDENGETITVAERHQLRGGTYCVGGSEKLHLNITYNYAPYYFTAFDEDGIRSLYGKKVVDTVQTIANAIVAVEGMVDIEKLQKHLYKRRKADPAALYNKLGLTVPDWSADDYWCPTRANAAKALQDLLALASLGLQGVWNGD